MSAHWKLRRLAARVKKVYGRHKDASPAVLAFEGPLLTAADGYVSVYGETTAYRARWRIEMDEGRGSMTALKKLLDIWKPHVARERPGFDLRDIGDNPLVPEDLVEDALALADELLEVKDASGAPVPWAQAAAATITAQAQTTERETDEAAAADSKYSDLQSRVRAANALFGDELGRFRATLRSVLGSSHPDVQKLRVNRASARDEDDDPSVPGPADPVTPAVDPPTS